MTKNMGTFDRLLRAIVAAVIIVLYAGGQISGTVALVLGIVAAVFLLTSLVSWCPGYLPFGLSTRKEGKS